MFIRPCKPGNEAKIITIGIYTGLKRIGILSDNATKYKPHLIPGRYYPQDGLRIRRALIRKGCVNTQRLFLIVNVVAEGSIHISAYPTAPKGLCPARADLAVVGLQ
jgi:methanogenic corrinoid protein MtbC1